MSSRATGSNRIITIVKQYPYHDNQLMEKLVRADSQGMLENIVQFCQVVCDHHLEIGSTVISSSVYGRALKKLIEKGGSINQTLTEEEINYINTRSGVWSLKIDPINGPTTMTFVRLCDIIERECC